MERSLKKPKKILVQSKLAFLVVTIIHTKKKQPTIDDEIEDIYDALSQQIRDTRQKIYTA